MIATSISFAIFFALAIWLMALQERCHHRNRSRMENNIAMLQDTILSKQRDYTAKKEEVAQLIQVREQLEKDLETAHRLGKQWQIDYGLQEAIAETLRVELGAERKALADLRAELIKELDLQSGTNELLKTEYKLASDALSTAEGELERITRKHEALKRNFSSLNERHAALKKEQEQDIQRLMRENFSLKSKLEIQKEDADGKDKELKQAKEIAAEFRSLRSGMSRQFQQLTAQNAETERQNRHLTVDLDRAEENYLRLLSFSQDYLRQLKLPELRIQEYCRLAREHVQHPDIIDALLAPNSPLSTLNSQLKGSPHEMPPLSQVRLEGLTHDQAAASEPDYPDAALPEMPF